MINFFACASTYLYNDFPHSNKVEEKKDIRNVEPVYPSTKANSHESQNKINKSKAKADTEEGFVQLFLSKL